MIGAARPRRAAEGRALSGAPASRRVYTGGHARFGTGMKAVESVARVLG
jgi:hypothetical protein